MKFLELLGIPDPWVWGAYVLSILGVLICVFYGILNWNKGGDDEKKEILEELEWEKKELEMEEEELGF